MSGGIQAYYPTLNLVAELAAGGQLSLYSLQSTAHSGGLPRWITNSVQWLFVEGDLAQARKLAMLPLIMPMMQRSYDDNDDSNRTASHTRRQGRRILDQLESYRSSDGTFTFKLSWPGSTYNGGAALDQVWKQTLNPVGAGQSLTTPVMGYEAVSVPYPAACGKPLHRASAAAQHEGGLAQDQLQLSAMSELAGSPDEARLNNLGDVWAGLGAVLEPCWAVLGVLGQSWGCPRALLRPSWSVLGAF